MQGFVLNLRRDQFKDVRLRRAFNYAYDFEEMNKQLFYGRTSASTVTSREPSLLLPDCRTRGTAGSRDGARQGAGGSLTAPYVNPVGGNPEAVRAICGRARGC